MDIKQISFAAERKKCLAVPLCEICDDFEPKPSCLKGGKNDVEITSSLSQNGVTDFQVIRIPTGQQSQQRSEVKQDGGRHYDVVSVVLTPADDGERRLLDQVNHSSDFDDAESDPMVRVRQPCDWAGGGPRAKVSEVVTPVSELMSEGVDIMKAQVDAIALERHFYNQWARLPREEDPESDVTTNTRRPISLRMLPATGSIKSHTLMTAILRDRDRQSPTEPGTSFRSGMSHEGSSHSSNSSNNSRSGSSRASRRAQGQSEGQTEARHGGRMMLSVGTCCSGEDELEELSDVCPVFRAQTASGVVRSAEDGSLFPSPGSPYRHDRTCSASICSTKRPGRSEGRKLHLISGSKHHRSGTSHSASSSSRLQHLPLNMASFLFSEDLDQTHGYHNNNRHHYYNHQHQRLHDFQHVYLNRTAKKRARAKKRGGGRDTREDRNSRDGPEQTSASQGQRNCSKEEILRSTPKSPDKTSSVHFIDVTEMKKLLLKTTQTTLRAKFPGEGEDGAMEGEGQGVRPVSRRAVSSAAYRHYGAKPADQQSRKADRGKLALSINVVRSSSVN